MHSVSPYVVQYAQQLGRQVVARALVIYADAIPREDEFRSVLLNLDFPTILISRSKEPESTVHPWITVPDMPMTRTAQIRSALLVCLARQVLVKGDRVIFLSGADGSGALDTMLVFEIGTEPELFSLAGSAPFVGDIAPEVFERVLTLATELAIEGREGRPVGSLFVVGDSDQVLAQSRSLVLNPFKGHPEAHRNILDPELEETIKEFAALDGAFVIRGDGVVLSAGSQLVPTAPYSQLPSGLGTRHAAAAGITASSTAIAMCISQSTGTVSIFKSGHLVTSLPRPVNGVRLAS